MDRFGVTVSSRFQDGTILVQWFETETGGLCGLSAERCDTLALIRTPGLQFPDHREMTKRMGIAAARTMAAARAMLTAESSRNVRAMLPDDGFESKLSA